MLFVLSASGWRHTNDIMYSELSVIPPQPPGGSSNNKGSPTACSSSVFFQPITATTASHRRRSLSRSSPLSDRSSSETAAAARWGQNLSPTSTPLSSPLTGRGSQSAGTSSSQLSITPFFTSRCRRAELRAPDRSSVSSRTVWTLNLGVLANVQSQLRSSAAAPLTPGNADSSAGLTSVEAALKPNSEGQNQTLIRGQKSDVTVYPGMEDKSYHNNK